MAVRTDKGLVRGKNEDAVVLGDLTTGEASIDGRIGPAGVLFGVCDGMGGEAAGEVASGIAAETVRKVMGLAQCDLDAAGLAKALMIAVELAGKAIKEHVLEHPKCQGMGTTCTVAAVRGSRMVVAHVGDSRAYLFRDGHLNQLTRDHNLANEMLARGTITREQVGGVLHGKHITQAVGSSDVLDVDLLQVELKTCDRVLVCSDGLSDMLEETTLADVLVGFADDVDAAADELVRRAKAAGGRDNISVVLSLFSTGEGVVPFPQPTLSSECRKMGAPATIEEFRLPVTYWPVWVPLGLVAVLATAGVWWWLGTVGSRQAGGASSAHADLPARAEQSPRSASPVLSQFAPTQSAKAENAPAVRTQLEVSPPAAPGPGESEKRVTDDRKRKRVEKEVQATPHRSGSSEADEGAVRPPEPFKRNPF